MANLDSIVLKNALIKAARLAFRDIKTRHAEETFYCMGIYTTGTFDYLLPTAMTEEGLDAVVRKYRNKSAYASDSVDQLRFSLRWSPCDSPLHLEAEEHFGEVNVMMDEICAVLQKMDMDVHAKESETLVTQLRTTICEAMRELDKEGLFGVGAERNRIFVTILMGDQDDSILHLGRTLNPGPSVKQFEGEWQKWGEYWKSKKY